MYKIPISRIRCILQPLSDNRITFLYPLVESIPVLDVYMKDNSIIRMNDCVMMFNSLPRSFPCYGHYYSCLRYVSRIETIHVRRGQKVSLGDPLYTIKLSTF